MSQYIAILGMGISAISFTKEELLKPLHHENNGKAILKIKFILCNIIYEYILINDIVYGAVLIFKNYN